MKYKAAYPISRQERAYKQGTRLKIMDIWQEAITTMDDRLTQRRHAATHLLS